MFRTKTIFGKVRKALGNMSALTSEKELVIPGSSRGTNKQTNKQTKWMNESLLSWGTICFVWFPRNTNILYNFLWHTNILYNFPRILTFFIISRNFFLSAIGPYNDVPLGNRTQSLSFDMSARAWATTRPASYARTALSWKKKIYWIRFS